MNRQVLLEGPEPDEEVQGLIDLSYRLTQSNNCKYDETSAEVSFFLLR